MRHVHDNRTIRARPARFPRLIPVALAAYLGLAVFGPDVSSTAAPVREPQSSLSIPMAMVPTAPMATVATTATPVANGLASWYGERFHGRPTASGEPFDMHGLTAAHRSLPFGTPVEVTNLHNGRTVVVRINDRGPSSRRRVIDVSYGAAQELGMVGAGTAPVEVVRLGR